MFISILTFILVLSILVLVHEAGHFFAARKAGVLVEEFGFGIPPRIFGKKYGETLYSINLLPFGGFVKLHGEDQENTITDPKRAFLNKKPVTRMLIIVAGVLMNFVLAVTAFAIVYSFSGVPRDAGYVEIAELAEGSPATASGMMVGDIVREVGGREVKNNKDFIMLVNEKSGEEVTIKVSREGTDGDLELKLVPRENPPEGEGALGVAIIDTEIYFPPWWQRPFLGVYHGVGEAVFWGMAVISGFVGIFSSLFKGVMPTDVAGPAGLYVITSEVAKVGILPLINWMGIISINLAILNIFPFPALDGGRLLFIIIEKAFGRRVKPKVEAWFHTIGFGLLILFLLSVTFREVNMIRRLGFQGYVEFLTQGQTPK